MNQNILRIYKSPYVSWKFIFSSDGCTEYAHMQKIFCKKSGKDFWELKMADSSSVEIFGTMTEILDVIERRWKAC